jgi:preprotein translocase subunit SecY
MPITVEQTLELSRTGALPGFAAFGILVLAIVVIGVIVFFERAQRRLLIQYPKRQVGNKMFQGDTSHLPLKVNTSGVIPVIFGSSLLLLPATITSFAAQGNAPTWLQYTAALLGRGQPLYLVLFAALIIFFSFFYTAIVLNPQDTADNLKRSGGFIPGIRPGERTAQYIDYVVTRITVVGAIYLTVVALVPEMIHSELNISQYIGGTSLIILVTVTLDTISQIQSHLIAQQYEGLVKQSRLGRRRR